MAVLTFPYDIIKIRDFSLDIQGQVISGGITQSGQQQVVNATGGGLWALKIDCATLRTPEQVRAWRIIQYGSQGGVVAVNVAICDLRHAPVSGVPHSDLTPFSDTSLYRWYGVVAELALSASLRATSAVISFAGGAIPKGGEFFSLPYGDDQHELHVITSVAPFGSNYAVTFVPPLRAAHAAGEAVEFKHPMCTYRLANQGSMSHTLSSGKRIDAPSATFIEAFT